MFRLHLERNLRSLYFVLVAGVLVLAPVGLWWANRTGLPESWRTAIEEKMAERGIHVRIGGLSYLPLRGLAANDVVIYTDNSRLRELSRVERMLVGFDNTRLVRGRFDVTRLQLRNADLVIPVDESNPDSDVLRVKRLNSTLLLPGSRRFEIRQTTGRIGGVEVELHMRLIGQSGGGSTQTTNSGGNTRRRIIADVVKELSKWNLDDKSPPRLELNVEGDLNNPSSVRSRIVIQSAHMERNGIELKDVHFEGEMAGGVLTVERLTAQDERGTIACRMDYDPIRKSGRFEGESSLDLLPLLAAWFGIHEATPVLFGGKQEIRAQGTYRILDSGKLSVEAMGRVKCGSVLLKGLPFDEISGAYSWKDGSFFMRDAELVRPDGKAKGKILVEWPIVRLAVQSDLPVAVYAPLFRGQPLEKVIQDFSARDGAVCRLDLEGGFDATDKTSWAYSGEVALENMEYRKVPVAAVSCRMSLNHHELDFTNGRVRFNYRDYPMRISFKGPVEGEVAVDRVRYRKSDKLVEVENVTGDFWAAPLVRMFASRTADTLEKYRFHTPPALVGNGVVDVTTENRTKLDVSFRSSSAATMEFLGEDIVLAKPVGKVAIRGGTVEISNLSTTSFGGSLKAGITVRDGSQLSGEISWTEISLPNLADTYGFSLKGGGELTGRLEFNMRSGKVETMNGKGLLAVDKTELFSVPMFGPLSHLIAGVLQDKRAGFERAKSAFCNFTIRDGVMETRDFSSSTRSLTFTGDGKVDLTKQTMDMTMRMNTHGLFSIITLPFRPFYGMFQFRGTGPIKNPSWENVMFTSPPEEQSQALGVPPRAREVK